MTPFDTDIVTPIVQSKSAETTQASATTIREVKYLEPEALDPLPIRDDDD